MDQNVYGGHASEQLIHGELRDTGLWCRAAGGDEEDDMNEQDVALLVAFIRGD